MELIFSLILGILAIVVARQWHQLEQEIKSSEAYYRQAVVISKISDR